VKTEILREACLPRLAAWVPLTERVYALLDTSASSIATNPDHYSHLRTFLNFNLFSVTILLHCRHVSKSLIHVSKSFCAVDWRYFYRLSHPTTAVLVRTSLSTRFSTSP
jgi:hypothetical protein